MLKQIKKIKNHFYINFLVEPLPPTFINIEEQKTILKQSVISIEATESIPIHIACCSADGRPASRIDWAITNDLEARNIISYITPDNNFHLQHPLRCKNFFAKKNKQLIFL